MPSLVLLKAPPAAGGDVPPPPRYALGTGGAGGAGAHKVYFIGRDAEQCQFVIPNGSVSRKHAALTLDHGRVLIEDLGSRNGTFVNQRRTTGREQLNHDDQIKICDFLYRYVDETAAKAANRVGDLEFDDPELDDGGDFTTVRHSLNAAQAREFLQVAPSERLRALLDISTSLSRNLELEPLLPEIGETLFRVFRQADRCFVILLDANNRLVPKYAKSLRGPTGDGDELRFSRTIVRKTLESLTAYMSEDAGRDVELSAAQSVAGFRIRTVLCVPMIASDGKALGAIQLDAQDLAKKFHDEDLKLLSIVGNIASVAVEKAQVHAALLGREKERQEIEIARKVQAGFLPKSVPAPEGYEFYSYYSPAQTVGGDYYDFLNLPGNRVGVVVGDVAGKGVAAALLMAKLSAEVRYAFLTEPDPARAVSLLNDQLIEGGVGERFVTFAALVLDPAAATITVVNAGHMNPFRLASGGVLSEIDAGDPASFPLGLVPGKAYSARDFGLAPGEVVIVYTDGVTDAEAPAGNRFGPDGVRRAVLAAQRSSNGGAKAVGAGLVRAVESHANGRAQSDDIALVCFGRMADRASGFAPAESSPPSGGPPTGRHPRPPVTEAIRQPRSSP